jgi:hypothetical protein
MKMQLHVVRQGEYLSQIAHRHGVAPSAIWDHEKNQALKDARMSGEILLPGDVLWVPVVTPKKHDVARGASNEYKTTIPRNQIRVVLKDGDEPLKNERYVITGLGDEPLEGSTDGDGLLAFDAPFSTTEVTVTLIDKRSRHTIRIGHLDPIETASGVRQRLEHLGCYGWVFDWVPEHMVPEHSEARDQHALRYFQERSKLEVTGVADDETLAALLDAHGS